MSNLIPFTTLVAPVTQQNVLTNILSVCQSLGLPITTWQSGDVGLTLIQVYSFQEAANTNGLISTYIQGGFLDYAANVTPDPSVTPGVAPGWLDVLASSVYNVSNTQGGTGRIQATYAPGNLVFTNTLASQGPFAPGTFHVANPATGATYSNTQTLTIGNGTTTAPFQADIAGKSSSAGPGSITQLVTTLLGVTVTNPAAFVGTNAESNAALVARCRAKLGSLSPLGPRSAYDYVSKTIPLPSPIVALSSGLLTTPVNPVTRTKQIVNLGTGTVQNYVASAAGAYTSPNLYTGSANESITGVTNANPAQITVTAHGYASGDTIYISGTGLTNLDGKAFTITVTGANTFTVPTASGGTSSTGSAYRQSDMDLIDKTVQTYCVPLGITCVNATATANTISITGTLYLKRGATSTSSKAQSDASAALANYFATLPIGGDDLGGASYYFLIEPMQAAISSPLFLPTGSTLANDLLRVVITSPNADVAANPTDVATLGTINWTVVNEV